MCLLLVTTVPVIMQLDEIKRLVAPLRASGNNVTILVIAHAATDLVELEIRVVQLPHSVET